jgi:hypothetical protein
MFKHKMDDVLPWKINGMMMDGEGQPITRRNKEKNESETLVLRIRCLYMECTRVWVKRAFRLA